VNYFPFNRKLVIDYKVDDKHLSITGLFITEVLKTATNQAGELIPDEITNPQLLNPDYLMRGRLEELNQSAFRHLTEKKWGPDQIRNGLTVIRTYLWDYWTEFTNYYLEENETEDDFYTGSQAGNKGPKSFRTWMNNSDPIFPLEYAPDDWMDSTDWADKKPSSWLDIYALVSLWSVDEAIVYLNSNDVFKATVWQERASILNLFFTLKNPVGKPGAAGKAKTYDPLKELVRELVTVKNYPSRRNAAMSIAPAIVAKSKELNMYFSKDNAPLTIAKWLKEMGLPKKI